MNRERPQRTIKKSQTFSGVGIHTGVNVEMSFHPADEGTGIVFRRTDLPGKPKVPATVEYVTGNARGTTLSVGDVSVHTVEHVLAAVRAFGIDNLRIDLSNMEPPAGDGSSLAYVQMLKAASVSEQASMHAAFPIRRPIYLSCNDVHIIALPSDTYRISYTLHYEAVASLGSQFFSMEVTEENFCEQIAPCRTFALYEELAFLMDRGLIRGGSLENAVVVHGDAIISRSGLVYSNEAVRHKVLDIIGDLSLVGIPFTAHIIALRSGHASNCQFAKELYQHIVMEKS